MTLLATAAGIRDDGSVMAIASRLAARGDAFERRCIETQAEADAWEEKRRAAQEAWFARKAAERGDCPICWMPSHKCQCDRQDERPDGARMERV